MFPSLRSPRNIMSNNVSSFARAFKYNIKLWLDIILSENETLL